MKLLVWRVQYRIWGFWVAQKQQLSPKITQGIPKRATVQIKPIKPNQGIPKRATVPIKQIKPMFWIDTGFQNHEIIGLEGTLSRQLLPLSHPEAPNAILYHPNQ